MAIGGALGAALRWAVVTSFEVGRSPWPVLALNVAGSVLLGVLVAEQWSHPYATLTLRDAGGVGFCGGLTTFSTFSLEIVNLVRHGDTRLAGIYTVVSVAAAVAGVTVGTSALRRVRAVTLPLEEGP